MSKIHTVQLASPENTAQAAMPDAWTEKIVVSEVEPAKPPSIDSTQL